MGDYDYGYMVRGDGVLPEAASPAWQKAGAGTVSLTAQGFRLVDASAVERLTYWLAAEESRDRLTEYKRAPDLMELQIKITGTSHSGADSPVLMWIDDGNRAMGVRIGSNIEWIHPGTLAVQKQIMVGFPWTSENTYRLIKDRSQRWLLWIGEELVSEIGYEEAPPAIGRPPATGSAFDLVGVPGWGWGCGSTAATATATFDRIEWSLGQPVPLQATCDRTALEYPLAHQIAWYRPAEGELRANVGLWQGATDALRDAWFGLHSGTVEAEAAFYQGDVLPTAEETIWAAINAGAISIVRERVRLTAVGATTGNTWTYTEPVWTEAPEYTVSCEWILRSTTPDVWGRLGPALRVTDGTRWAVAQMIQTLETVGDPPVSAFIPGWALTTNVTDSAPVTQLGARGPWRVDQGGRHHVEVVLQAPTWVYLLVDGQIVDRVAYDQCSFV